VHLNPIRAKLLKPAALLESFRWSSYGDCLKPPSQRLGWLRVDRLLGEKGIPKDSETGRRQFVLLTERRRQEESATDYHQIRRGWCPGSDEFRNELLAAATEQVGPSDYGAIRQETGEQKALRLLRQEFKRLGQG